MGDLLQGVRKDDWAGGKLPHALSSKMAGRGEVLYRVLEKLQTGEPAGKSGAEKRAAERKRTRLRSGKLLDSRNQFISECLIFDHSKGGWRVKLARNVGAPTSCRLYDDETRSIAVGTIVWRKDGLLGIRKLRALASADVAPFVRNMLRGKYYAVDT